MAVVDKPRGVTSHTVVAQARRLFGRKDLGHAGTLDPMATGLLIVLVGKATRVSQYLISLDKEYEGTIEFGKITDTQDADGEVMETRPVPALTQSQVEAAIKTFLGDQYQTPPMFSAIKIDGVPLYKSARKGEEVEREPRFIRVVSWDITGFAPPRFDFRLRCTKGTYVRTLAHDLGQKIGCGAFLAALRRTATDKFNVSQAITIDDLQKLTPTEIEKRLIAPRDAVPSFVL